MEGELEKFFTYLGANAFKEYGWQAMCLVVLAFVVLRFLIGLAQFAWAKRRKIWERLLPGRHVDRWVRLFKIALPAITIISILMLPSNPVVASVFLIGFVVVIYELPQPRPSSEAVHYAILAFTLLCFSLTLGGIIHDVVWPPIARCADGYYSNSATRRGTCSWHGGVSEWDPNPWWKAVFI